MNTKIKIKKGDEVIVNVGKNKGKTGKILKIIPSKNKVIVSGINIFKKHTKPNNNDTGGIKEKEMPLHISNVSIYDKENKKGIKVGYSFLKDGTKVRINRKTKKELN
tara:strand:- start:192 stop:512 length:321 start_codon:yes stop_codon:yes gene_type:complete